MYFYDFFYVDMISIELIIYIFVLYVLDIVFDSCLFGSSICDIDIFNFVIIKNNFMCMMISYGYYRKIS